MHPTVTASWAHRMMYTWNHERNTSSNTDNIHTGWCTPGTMRETRHQTLTTYTQDDVHLEPWEKHVIKHWQHTHRMMYTWNHERNTSSNTDNIHTGWCTPGTMRETRHQTLTTYTQDDVHLEPWEKHVIKHWQHTHRMMYTWNHEINTSSNTDNIHTGWCTPGTMRETRHQTLTTYTQDDVHLEPWEKHVIKHWQHTHRMMYTWNHERNTSSNTDNIHTGWCTPGTMRETRHQTLTTYTQDDVHLEPWEKPVIKHWQHTHRMMYTWNHERNPSSNTDNIHTGWCTPGTMRETRHQTLTTYTQDDVHLEPWEKHVIKHWQHTHRMMYTWNHERNTSSNTDNIHTGWCTPGTMRETRHQTLTTYTQDDVHLEPWEKHVIKHWQHTHRMMYTWNHERNTSSNTDNIHTGWCTPGTMRETRHQTLTTYTQDDVHLEPWEKHVIKHWQHTHRMMYTWNHERNTSSNTDNIHTGWCTPGTMRETRHQTLTTYTQDDVHLEPWEKHVIKHWQHTHRMMYTWNHERNTSSNTDNIHTGWCTPGTMRETRHQTLTTYTQDDVHLEPWEKHVIKHWQHTHRMMYTWNHERNTSSNTDNIHTGWCTPGTMRETRHQTLTTYTQDDVHLEPWEKHVIKHWQHTHRMMYTWNHERNTSSNTDNIHTGWCTPGTMRETRHQTLTTYTQDDVHLEPWEKHVIKHWQHTHRMMYTWNHERNTSSNTDNIHTGWCTPGTMRETRHQTLTTYTQDDVHLEPWEKHVIKHWQHTHRMMYTWNHERNTSSNTDNIHTGWCTPGTMRETRHQTLTTYTQDDVHLEPWEKHVIKHWQHTHRMMYTWNHERNTSSNTDNIHTGWCTPGTMRETRHQTLTTYTQDDVHLEPWEKHVIKHWQHTHRMMYTWNHERNTSSNTDNIHTGWCTPGTMRETRHQTLTTYTQDDVHLEPWEKHVIKHWQHTQDKHSQAWNLLAPNCCNALAIVPWILTVSSEKHWLQLNWCSW